MVLPRLANLRDLRASILGIAVWTLQQDDRDGIILCVEARLSAASMADELARVRSALHPRIQSRVHLLAAADAALPAQLANAALQKGITKLSGADLRRRPSGHAANHVTMLLLRDWLIRGEQRSMKSIAETIGLSYPTVARALEGLEPWLERGPYKRVAFRQFPEEAWARMCATASSWRETFAFDSSPGMARPTTALIERLSTLQRTDLALGGVEGARSYDAGLDLVGSPRLDIVMHVPAGRPDLAWVSRLDPGLTAGRPSPTSRVVVHLLRRREPLFRSGPDLPCQIADPAECLLDLVELRLGEQASALIRKLPKTAT